MKLGKCETWILLNAPGPTEDPKFIDREYENCRLNTKSQSQIVRRAKRKLEFLGLIETVRKRFPATTHDEKLGASWYGTDDGLGPNHRFWANHVRLTPYGQKVMEAHITSDNERGHK
jgi:hypothetical protein